MSESWRRRLFMVGISLGLGLFFYQIWLAVQAWGTLSAGLAVQLPYLFYGMLCALAAYGLQIAVWTFIMRQLGVPLQIVDAVRGYTLSFLPRYIPGSVWGYWGRSHWLSQAYGTPYRVSLLGSVYEAGYLVVSAFMVGLGYLGTHLEVVDLRFGHPLLWIAGLFVALLVASILFWICSPAVFGNYFMRKQGRSAVSPASVFPGRLQDWIAVIVVLGLYLVMWVLHGWAIQFIGGIFVRSGLDGNAWGIIAATALAWAAGFLVLLVPSGLGVRELSLVVLLQRLGLVDTNLALLMATLSRVFLLASELIWVLLSFAFTFAHQFRVRRGSNLPGKT